MVCEAPYVAGREVGPAHVCREEINGPIRGVLLSRSPRQKSLLLTLWALLKSLRTEERQPRVVGPLIFIFCFPYTHGFGEVLEGIFKITHYCILIPDSLWSIIHLSYSPLDNRANTSKQTVTSLDLDHGRIGFEQVKPSARDIVTEHVTKTLPTLKLC